MRAYVQQAAAEQLTAEMGPGAADIAEIVADVRGKLPDLGTPPVLEPEPARFRLFDSITTFLKNAAQRQPLMLVLDDLHWAERLGPAVCCWSAPTGTSRFPGAIPCPRPLEPSSESKFSTGCNWMA